MYDFVIALCRCTQVIYFVVCLNQANYTWHCDEIQLNVEDDNDIAKKFYASQGFASISGDDYADSRLVVLSIF